MITAKSKKINTNQRKFYQTLMTVAFSLDTGHRYHYVLRFIIYLAIIDWFLSVRDYNFIYLAIFLIQWKVH